MIFSLFLNSFIAFGYVDSYKVQINVKSIDKTDINGQPIVLQEHAANALERMIQDADKDGIELLITSSYRTHKKQGKIKNTLGDMAAPPGKSNHELGLSVDIGNARDTVEYKDLRKYNKRNCVIENNTYKCKSKVFWWLSKNANKYGFYNDIGREPWHWTYFHDSSIGEQENADFLTADNKF